MCCSKSPFWNTIRLSNGLDSIQDSVGPDLGLNCLQRLSASSSSPKQLPQFLLSKYMCLSSKYKQYLVICKKIKQSAVAQLVEH